MLIVGCSVQYIHGQNNAGLCNKPPSSIFIGGRQFNNLRFADDIYLIAGSEIELQTITHVLEKISTVYGMEMNHDKCKIIVNGELPTPMIYMYDKQIENVDNFI